jgi:hypothetical protein
MHPSRPNALFMQKHWDVMRSDDAGESWREVSGNPTSDFGFPIEVHAHEPDSLYAVPIKRDSENFPPDGTLRVYRSRTGGPEWEALTKGLPQRDCYVNVLRDTMAVDSLDPCGVYSGTSGGQVYASADARTRDPRVKLEVQGPVTQRSILDALEASYPMLRGTIRDRVTQERRRLVRLFTCGQDLSHEQQDMPLPDAVATGAERHWILGAMAGG